MKIGLVCMYGIGQSVKSIYDAFLRTAGNTVEVFPMFPAEVHQDSINRLKNFDGDMIFSWQALGCPADVIEEQSKKIKTVVWVFDDPNRLEVKREFDTIMAHNIILSCDAGSVKKYNEFGKLSYWFPPAGDLSLYASALDKDPTEYISDISFVGTGYGLDMLPRMLMNRQDLMTAVKNRYSDKNIKIWAAQPSSWGDLADMVGRHLNHEEVHLSFMHSKINLNLQGCFYNAYKYINERTSMILSSGGFLLMDRTPGLGEWLIDKEHVVYYDNLNDCLDKIDYYLNHEPERAQIAKNGHEFIKNNWTYDHFVKKLRSIK